jgi:hypothetical protein
MSDQEIARALAAAGSVRPSADEDEFYLLNLNGRNLVEKLWKGDESKNETVVTSNAKEDTSASYILDVDEGQVQRSVFFIDQSNIIQCYAADEFDAWDSTGFGEKWNITTGPASKISASVGPDGGVVVSYQDAAGRLVGTMTTAEGIWEPFGPLPADPIAGTPQVLDVVDNKLHLFYVGKEGSLRYLVLNDETGAWQDNVINNTNLETKIDNFSVTKNPETGSFESCLLTAGSMWAVDGDKKTKVGAVEGDGKLIPSNNAQAGYHRRTRWGSNARYVEITHGPRGKTRIWYW